MFFCRNKKERIAKNCNTLFLKPKTAFSQPSKELPYSEPSSEQKLSVPQQLFPMGFFFIQDIILSTLFLQAHFIPPTTLYAPNIASPQSVTVNSGCLLLFPFLANILFSLHKCVVYNRLWHQRFSFCFLPFKNV